MFRSAYGGILAGMTARQLEKIRRKLRLTPTEMARAMNVSYSQYWAWESGSRNMSRPAVRLAEVLAMHPETARELAHSVRS